jgi:hypothetical protein
MLNARFQSIYFLRLKIKHLIGLIYKGNVDISTEIAESVWKNFKKIAMYQLPKKRDTSEIYKITYNFPGISFDNHLLFNLDTLFSDVRRCIEFVIRFIIESQGFKDLENFSLQKFMIQIEGLDRKQKEAYVTSLVSMYPAFINYLNSIKSWIKLLNDRRTAIMHYQTFNRTGSFKVSLVWDPGQLFTKKPRIEYPIIPLFNTPITSVVRECEEKLDEFIKKAFELKRGLILDSSSQNLF